jgi:hypothetical protein
VRYSFASAALAIMLLAGTSFAAAEGRFGGPDPGSTHASRVRAALHVIPAGNVGATVFHGTPGMAPAAPAATGAVIASGGTTVFHGAPGGYGSSGPLPAPASAAGH